MSDLAERIHNAHTHVERLLSERDRLATSHTSLEEELRDLRRNGEVLQARLTELERENEVLRTVKATPVAEDRSGSKEKIDELVNEIDRCLALLNT